MAGRGIFSERRTVSSLFVSAKGTTPNHPSIAGLGKIKPNQIENHMPYRVLQPFLVLLNEPHRFTTIREGKIIKFEGDPLRAGLADALYEGESVSVFMVDVRNCC